MFQPATSPPDRTTGRTDAGFIAGIALCLALQFHLVFVQEINWDEFYFLSFVHDHQRGSLVKALQTVHVWFFAWLPLIGTNEIDQIGAARAVLLLLEAGTVALIYGTCRAFLSRPAALVAALAYPSSAYVLLHGASFRADPIAAFLLMLALFSILRGNLRAPGLLTIAAALALAALVTVKAVFYAPAIAAAVLWRLSGTAEKRALLVRLAVAGGGALLLFALLYTLHLSTMPNADGAASQAMVSSAYEKTLLSAGLLPRVDFLARGIMLAPVQAILLLAGTVIALASLTRRDRDRRTALILLLLAAPLASFLVYRNAFPYFFAFILPPAMPLAGYAVERLAGRRMVLLGLAAAMVATAAIAYAGAIVRDRTAQEETVAAVHGIFPEPVPYIDRCSMIASFPKHGFFMSTWGIEDYRVRGRPIMETLLAEGAPPLLIANSPALVDALGGSATAGAPGLLPRDAATLRNNFVHHWGALWVAGKVLDVTPAGRMFDLAIAGTYTVEAAAPVEIDGNVHVPGSVVTLARGRHGARAAAPVRLTLRWGDRLPKPADPPASTPIFWGF